VRDALISKSERKKYDIKKYGGLRSAADEWRNLMRGIKPENRVRIQEKFVNIPNPKNA
jgi:hypothetical protein